MLIKIKEKYFDIEDHYMKMNSMPDDPAHSAVYGLETDGTAVFMMLYPVDKGQEMPFDKPDYVITGVRGALAEDQGMIKVDSGKTKRGHRYIYSIIKTRLEPSGVQYNLTLHIDLGDDVIGIRYFADEIGVTGMRDTLIFNNALQEKIVDDDMNGWTSDPYDPSYKKGFLMNFSEQDTFDKLFPDHPLSVLRSFITYFIAHN